VYKFDKFEIFLRSLGNWFFSSNLFRSFQKWHAFVFTVFFFKSHHKNQNISTTRYNPKNKINFKLCKRYRIDEYPLYGINMVQALHILLGNFLYKFFTCFTIEKLYILCRKKTTTFKKEEHNLFASNNNKTIFSSYTSRI